MAKETGILETIGTIFGLVTGGPGGAAGGALIGSLLGGNNLQDAFKSGIGTLFNTNPQLNLMSQMMNMGGGGGGAGSSKGQMSFGNVPVGRGLPAANAGSSWASNPLGQALGIPGAMQGGAAGLFNTMISQQTGNPMQALMAGLLMNQMTKNKNPWSKLEQQQYVTGERNPDYQGTPVPDYRYTPTMRVAQGGLIRGPGTGKSDSIPATIYQNGGPVQEARLSDGEFVMTADAVRGAGGGDRARGAAQMYRMMNQLEGRA